jgi:hypothetical protein
LSPGLGRPPPRSRRRRGRRRRWSCSTEQLLRDPPLLGVPWETPPPRPSGRRIAAATTVHLSAHTSAAAPCVTSGAMNIGVPPLIPVPSSSQASSLLRLLIRRTLWRRRCVCPCRNGSTAWAPKVADARGRRWRGERPRHSRRDKPTWPPFTNGPVVAPTSIY